MRPSQNPVRTGENKERLCRRGNKGPRRSTWRHDSKYRNSDPEKLQLHRPHLGTHMRDANRDRPLAAPKNWDDTAEALWLHLSGHLTSPSAAAVKREARTRLAEA